MHRRLRAADDLLPGALLRDRHGFRRRALGRRVADDLAPRPAADGAGRLYRGAASATDLHRPYLRHLRVRGEAARPRLDRTLLRAARRTREVRSEERRVGTG